MLWVNALGIYLLAGTVLMGIGLIRKAGWVAAGKIKPPNMGKYEKVYVAIGITLGVLFWPVFLAGITIMWRMKRRTRNLERSMGYCEHSTVFEPICGPCSRDIERENGSAVTGYLVGIPLPDDKRRVAEAVATYIKDHPTCLKCGKAGDLIQYRISSWMKCRNCGHRTYTPGPSVPEEVDVVPGYGSVEGQMAGASYQCSACGSVSEGFPPAANAEGFPLCAACQKSPPR